MHQGIRFRTSRKKSKIQFRKWNFQVFGEITAFLDLIKPQKVRVTRNSNRVDLNLTLWFFLFFKSSTQLRGTTLSSENIGSWSWSWKPGCSDPMLDDDGVQQGKNVSLGKTMLAETFSWEWAKDWKLGFKRMRGIRKESTHSRLFLLGRTRGLNAV